MLAVCLAIAGRTNGRERDREEGLGYYTSSLKEMAAELKGRGRVDHTTLVVTARLFSLYEVGTPIHMPLTLFLNIPFSQACVASSRSGV